MTQVSKISAQSTHVFTNLSKPHQPKAVCSVSVRVQCKGRSISGRLKHNERSVSNIIRAVRVSASVGTAEKQSKASEIVLQPIKEISGTVTLPGSKSLSNRILLLAALSEVCRFLVFLRYISVIAMFLIFIEMYTGEMNLIHQTKFDSFSSIL